MDGRPSPFSTGSRGLVSAPAAGHGLVLSSAGAGRRVDGGLRSVAEVAATVFQSEKWEGERGWMCGIAPLPTLTCRDMVGSPEQVRTGWSKLKEVF